MHVDGAQAGATAASATPAASSTSAPSLAGAVADACARSNGSEVIALTEYPCITGTNVQILTLSRMRAREAPLHICTRNARMLFVLGRQVY
jgi:hypothetical protein